jgi:hypothetical protein
MIMRLLLAFTTGVGLTGGSLLALDATSTAPKVEQASYFDADAPLAPKRIIIGLDISLSNPLIDDRDFAAKVGLRIGKMISEMGFASEVHVRTFGSYDASQNAFYYDEVLSTRARPENIAAEVEKLIAGVPTLVERGKFHPQKRTNILGFLENVHDSIGCSRMPTTIVLASDGIEDSEYARLDDPDDHLPAPDGHPFRGCDSLQILGVGQGTHSPKKTARLRYEWQRWAEEAGFASFQGLNDW